MPNYEVRFKHKKKVNHKVFIGRDMDDVREQFASRYPGGEILSIEQRGPGGPVQPKPGAVPATTTGGGWKKLVAFVALLAGLAAGYFLLTQFGIL
jgi:hypothetical protein